MYMLSVINTYSFVKYKRETFNQPEKRFFSPVKPDERVLGNEEALKNDMKS